MSKRAAGAEASAHPAGAGVVARAPGEPEIPETARLAFLAAVQAHQKGHNDGALKLYARALEIFPGFSDAYNNIGVILRAQDKLSAAAACFRRALQFRADSASVLSNLGNVLWQMLRFDEAAAAYRRAIELEPTRAETLHNLGLLLHSLGDYPGAIDSFTKSLDSKPNVTDVLWDRSLTRLAMGDFARGWAEYEVRWRLKQNPQRHFPFPLWEGQESPTLSLLVHHEQGLGDTIQFCRFLPLLARRLKRVVFECPSELTKLIECLPGIEIVAVGRELPSCDYHVPLLNVPRYLKTDLANIPAEIPYLRAPAGAEAPTFHRPAGTKLAIGVAWAGKSTHNNDKNRSTDLEHFLCLADLPGVTLYSLQKGLRTADLQTVGAQTLIEDLGSKLRDFAETTALLPKLDLVIGVDTAIVHLGGAVGVPTFALIPFTPDWRWMNGREDTPWYPTVRLFRQPQPGDWDPVFARVREAVQARL